MLEARLLLAAGKPFDAKRILEQVRPLVAKTRGAVASVDVALGHCHRQLGEFDLELTAFERALTVAHDSVAALVGVARALAASGRDTEALARYREAASAAMPEIWRPLVQLESAAISKRLAARPDWTPVEALARSLEACPQLGPTGSVVLRAEVLAGKGLHEDACLLLEESAAAAPLDVVLQSARLVMSAKTGDAARVDTVLGSLPDQLRDNPTILRAEADAAGLMPLPGAGHVFADVEERGVAAPSDDDALDIVSTLFSCALADGRHHDAFRIADRMVQRCPRSPRAALALVAIGRVARDGATLHRAAGLLEGDLTGASTEARYAKAASMLQDVLDDRQTARLDKQRLRDIRNLLAEVEQSRPNWTAGLSLAGDLDGAEGKDDDAARQYAEALRQCLDDVTIVRPLVRLHMRRRQFADARRVLSELDDVGGRVWPDMPRRSRAGRASPGKRWRSPHGQSKRSGAMWTTWCGARTCSSRRARLLDDLGFRRAADTLLQRAASRSADAQAIRIAALIRRGLAEEALASIESAWDETAVDASLQQLSGLLTARTAIVNDDLCGRVDRLCDKARAFAADSPELSLVLAELRLVQERRGEAEQILRSLLDREGLTAGHRTRATAALVVCLACEPISRDVDRVIGAAIQAIGPVPVLLDARAMSRLSRGEAADALRDCREAALAPSPQRLLHLAKALAETDDLDGAGVVLTRAFEHLLVPDALLQPEKQWCEALRQKIGPAPMP